MIAAPELEKTDCPHCLGRTYCDCKSCGRKVWYIDFAGKLYKYVESGRCKICGGKGTVSAPRH